MVLLAFLLVSCASQSVDAQSGEPVFTVEQKNQEDQITVQTEGQSTVIDISSPSGIGSAVFKLESGRMPESLTLQLHLMGLESLRVSSGESTVSASISSSDPLHRQDQMLIEPGGESPITPGHPLWINVRIVSNETGTDIPLQQGYFEAEIPKGFVDAAGTSFEISWIDFYR